MTSSPELIHELRASRPSAPLALRARVREIAADPSPARRHLPRFHLPIRRLALVAVPATVALAFLSAGVLGLSRADVRTEAAQDQLQATVERESTAPNAYPALPESQGKSADSSALAQGAP